MTRPPVPADKPIHQKLGDEARGALVGVVVGTVLGPFVRELLGRHSERLAKRVRRATTTGSLRAGNPTPRRSSPGVRRRR